MTEQEDCTSPLIRTQARAYASFPCPRDAWEHAANYFPLPWAPLLAETDLRFLLATGQPQPTDLARRWGWPVARVLTLQAGGGR